MCVGAHFANLSSSNTLTFSGYAALPQNFTQMGQALDKEKTVNKAFWLDLILQSKASITELRVRFLLNKTMQLKQPKKLLELIESGNKSEITDHITTIIQKHYKMPAANIEPILQHIPEDDVSVAFEFLLDEGYIPKPEEIHFFYARYTILHAVNKTDLAKAYLNKLVDKIEKDQPTLQALVTCIATTNLLPQISTLQLNPSANANFAALQTLAANTKTKEIFQTSFKTMLSEELNNKDLPLPASNATTLLISLITVSDEQQQSFWFEQVADFAASSGRQSRTKLKEVANEVLNKLLADFDPNQETLFPLNELIKYKHLHHLIKSETLKQLSIEQLDELIKSTPPELIRSDKYKELVALGAKPNFLHWFRLDSEYKRSNYISFRPLFTINLFEKGKGLIVAPMTALAIIIIYIMLGFVTYIPLILHAISAVSLGFSPEATIRLLINFLIFIKNKSAKLFTITNNLRKNFVRSIKHSFNRNTKKAKEKFTAWRGKFSRRRSAVPAAQPDTEMHAATAPPPAAKLAACQAPLVAPLAESSPAAPPQSSHAAVTSGLPLSAADGTIDLTAVVDPEQDHKDPSVAELPAHQALLIALTPHAADTTTVQSAETAPAPPTKTDRKEEHKDATDLTAVVDPEASPTQSIYKDLMAIVQTHPDSPAASPPKADEEKTRAEQEPQLHNPKDERTETDGYESETDDEAEDVKRPLLQPC